MWILPLDSDDTFSPTLLAEVVGALASQGFTMGQPRLTNYNVIMPALADGAGTLTPWQPRDPGESDLLDQNTFHCGGFFLRSMWSPPGEIPQGLHYDPSLLFGWEDWAFWARMHHIYTIRPLMLTEPGYVRG